MKLQGLSMLAACLAFAAAANAQGTRLLRHPTVSRDMVAFAYAGDLWTTPRAGGEARRLTATPNVEGDPYFSPDGSQIAFTATAGGNTDVYVVAAGGGEPKRLTWHPGPDRARGWTPDGKRVIFASTRTSAPQESYFQLWSVALEGGLPERLPMPRAFQASYSPDAHRLAYQAITLAFMPIWDETSRWRRYRGGRTQPIRILNLADHRQRRRGNGIRQQRRRHRLRAGPAQFRSFGDQADQAPTPRRSRQPGVPRRVLQCIQHDAVLLAG